MALGGGSFISQSSSQLPGAYINFVSAATANINMSDRGYAGMGLLIDWGPDDEIFEVTKEDFQKNSLKIFGYTYSDEKMKGLRDLFKHLNVLYAYKLTDGVAASNTFATALYKGTRGNALKIVIAANVDEPTWFDVSTYLGTTKVDLQTVETIGQLDDNDYVRFNYGATLAVTASAPLVNGTTENAAGVKHQDFLSAIESYPQVNVVAFAGAAQEIASLYVEFVKRMRDTVGIKMQAVLSGYNGADYEGVVVVDNIAYGDDFDGSGTQSNALVYWVAGLLASAAVNESCTNRLYDGEFEIDTNYTQNMLKERLANGKFTLHKVGNAVRVLGDINSLITVTDTKGEVFKSNQTIRVIDQIATDIATTFVTRYLGIIPNDADGRASLWGDIVKHHKALERLRAIENFSADNVTVTQGDTKKAVVVSDVVDIVNAMERLYMTVKVS